MEPLDYLEALRRRWALVAVVLLVTGAAFWLTAPVGIETSPTDYSATHTLLVDHESSTRSGVQTNLRVLAVLATSGDIPQRVTQRLGLPESPQALMERVQVDADQKMDVLRISSTGAEPEAIAALVDTFANEILRVAGERNEMQRNEAVARAKAITAAQQTRIKDLEARIAQLPPGGAEARLAAAERDALLDVYARQQGVLQNLASQPPGPGLLSLGPAVPLPTAMGDPSYAWVLRISADRRARLLGGSVLGVLLGCGLAVLIYRLDSRVRSRRQAERAFGLPVVAEISRARFAPARHSPLNPASSLTSSDVELVEAYRQLAFAVLHTPRWVLAPRPPGDEEEPGIPPARLVQGPSRLVVLTSAAREGVRNAIVANLAASLAAIGREVIAVDADHERPSLAEYLGAYGEDGGDPSGSSMPGAPRPLSTTVAGVRAAPQASLLPGDLAAARGIIDRYLGLADTVLVSCPPILSGAEAAEWAVEADAVLVVASSGSTTAEAASVAREYLARLQAQVLGVAFVAAERHRGSFAPILRRRRPGLAASRHAPTSQRPIRDGETLSTPRPHPEDDLRRRQEAAGGPAGNGEPTAPRLTDGELQGQGTVAPLSSSAAGPTQPAAEPETTEVPVPEAQVSEVQTAEVQVLVPEPSRPSPNGRPRRRMGEPLPRANLERPSDRARL